MFKGQGLHYNASASLPLRETQEMEQISHRKLSENRQFFSDVRKLG
jgi:hypothetical protein